MNVGEIKIYKSKSGEVKLEARVKDETIWLTQQQMADLFDVNQPAIAKHINSIYKTGELPQEGTYSILEYMGVKGDSAKRKYKTKFYNLDAIISVGYRVNSQKATDFRIWSTKILKEYLVAGAVVNQKRLLENQGKLIEAKELLLMIGKKAKFELLEGHERDLLDLIADYAKSWRVLEGFDEKKLTIKKLNKQVKFSVSYDGFLELIGEMKNELAKLKINIYLFGQEVGPKLKSAVGAVNQTFDGSDLYPSVEEKAANLLYLIIKDHPFADGNKRIASMLFIYFLENNDFLYLSNGERKINNNTLIALALLVATSDPKEKESITRLIINLIQD